MVMVRLRSLKDEADRMGTEIFVENKEIVVPGTKLAQGRDFIAGTGTYWFDDCVVSKYLGIVYFKDRLVRVVPLAGKYDPRKGDTVIGIVEDVRFTSWLVDIGAPFLALLPAREILSPDQEEMIDLYRVQLKGDALLCRIANVDRKKKVTLTMNEPGLRKLKRGKVIEIDATKVPRVIGKHGSMISLIKEATGCKIIVGQNGKIWISGEPEKEELAARAIKLIEARSHISGLTDKVKVLLEEEQIGE